MPSNGFTHESTHNESKEWYTPKYIFDALGIEFDLDPCSAGREVTPWVPVKKHFTVRDDGFTQLWEGNVWMNPPYGSDTPKWMERLAVHGNGIALVFGRSDTQWFHSTVPRANAVCFIKGRVKFIRADDALVYSYGDFTPKAPAGAGSILIAFGESNAQALINSNLGMVLSIKDALLK